VLEVERAEHRVTVVGDVAGGEHSRHARLQPLVDDNAPGHFEPRPLGELGAGQHADAYHHEVAVECAAVGQAHPLDPSGALEGLKAGPGDELGPVIAVDVCVNLADPGPEDALEGDRALLDDGHLEPLLARRGGDLGPDPSRPDDHEAPTAGDALADPLGVAQLAEVEDALEIGAGHSQSPGRGAGGEEQSVVPEALTSGEHDLRGLRVDLFHRRRRAQLDVMLGVEVGVVDEELLALGLGPDEVLGERRALVGRLVLGADQDDASVEALLAQGLGRLRSGEARADDHVGGLGGHGRTSVLLSGVGLMGRRSGTRMGPRHAYGVSYLR
jgi:hypothetical protein